MFLQPVRLNNFFRFSFLSLILIASFFISKNANATVLTNITYSAGGVYGDVDFYNGNRQRFYSLQTNIKQIAINTGSHNNYGGNYVMYLYDAAANLIGTSEATYLPGRGSKTNALFVFTTKVPAIVNAYYYFEIQDGWTATGGNGESKDGENWNWNGTSWVKNWSGLNLNNTFIVYYDDAPTLSITSTYYDQFNAHLSVAGTCEKYGSGVMQLSFYATSYPDPNGVWRMHEASNEYQSLINCDNSGQFLAYYNTIDMIGTTTFFIDDTLYGTAVASTSVLLVPAGTGADWSGSWGYMSSDDPNYTAHNLACTDTEWATPDPVIGIDWLNATTSIPAFNFKVIGCTIVQKYWIFTFNIRDTAKSSMGGYAAGTNTIFPYNFATQIQTSWVASASSTMPSSLAWLNSADSNGNVNISVFNNSSSTAATSTVIWGTAIFSQNASTTAAYAGIRAFTTYLLWGLFFIWLIYMAYEVKNHLHN